MPEIYGDIINITDKDGNTKELMYIDQITRRDTDYIAFMETKNEDEIVDDVSIFFFKIVPDENNPDAGTLIEIEDEQERDEIGEIFFYRFDIKWETLFEMEQRLNNGETPLPKTFELMKYGKINSDNKGKVVVKPKKDGGSSILDKYGVSDNISFDE